MGRGKKHVVNINLLIYVDNKVTWQVANEQGLV